MHIKTLQKLERLGWNPETLQYIKENFAPKKIGKYKLCVHTMNHAQQPPEDGLLIDTAFFSDERELSRIHHFYQGNGYVLYLAETDAKISSGILNGSPFAEVEEEGWKWMSLEEANARRPRRTKKEIEEANS